MIARRRLKAIPVTLLFAVAGVARAQVVHGAVTMADGTTRVAGVIVVANATTGSGATARALTNARGDYSIKLPAPGTYALQVLRIGYQPTEGPTVTVAANATAEASIQLSGSAVSLRAVTVREDDVCRTHPDTGALVARAWEEARKAIMASGLAATDAPLVAEWIEYTRTLDASGRIVRGQHVKTTTNPTTHAFKSAPAESLAARGYVTADAGETTFHAPDGDVLLSNSFAATHCFQLAPIARGADTLIGVSFRPAHDRREARDIEGSLWLDRRTAELRWLEYRYTNLPSATDRAEPGGRVDFLRLGTGGWLIGKWNIRMPELGAGPVGNAPAQRTIMRAPTGGVLKAIQLTGGVVTRVSRGDSLVFQADGTALDVRIVSSDPLVSTTGATVELLGTDYVAVAGTDGRALLKPVLEGRYEARIHTPLMDSLGVAPITREFTVNGGLPRQDTVHLASAAALVRSACRDSLESGQGMLRGSVRDSSGRGIPNATVVVSFLGGVKVLPGQKADRVQWTDQTIGAVADTTGHWRVCGVPQGALTVVRTQTDLGSDARRVRLDSAQAIGATDLVAHAEAKTVDIVLPKDNRAVVEFSVTDGERILIPGATLDVEFPDASRRTLITGSTGRALVPDVAPGRLVVRARKIGFLPGQLVATVAAGRNTLPIVLSQTAMPHLDTVRVLGDNRVRNGRLDEFETRRLNGAATRSITRAEIEKRNPVDAWQMMTNISSVKIAQLGGLVIARSMRVENAKLTSDKPCYMRAMVDGVLLPEDTSVDGSNKNYATNLASLPPPDAIHGIEVFAGPASIPPQYGGSGTNKWCGLIAVWTR